MLNTLKNLDSRLQRCVDTGNMSGKANTLRVTAGSMSRTNDWKASDGDVLVNQAKSQLRGRVGWAFNPRNTEERYRIDEMDSVQLKQGLMNGSLVLEYSFEDECELTADVLRNSQCPAAYVGAQHPRYIRSYDRDHLYAYLSNCNRTGGLLRDPVNRVDLANRNCPYNPGNIYPVYPQGSTVFPPMQPFQPLPGVFYQAPVQPALPAAWTPVQIYTADDARNIVIERDEAEKESSTNESARIKTKAESEGNTAYDVAKLHKITEIKEDIRRKNEIRNSIRESLINLEIELGQHEPEIEFAGKMAKYAAQVKASKSESQLIYTNRINLLFPGHQLDKMLESRFSPDIKTRVLYAIRHFYMGDENIDFSDFDIMRTTQNGGRQYTTISEKAAKLWNKIDIRGLFKLIHYDGETEPERVDSDIFGGETGVEDDAIVLMRDRGANHLFQNGRGVMDEESYIELILYVLFGYFYVGLTSNRCIKVFYIHNSNFWIFEVEYLAKIGVDGNDIEVKTASFELKLKDYMGQNQRWVLKMVDVRSMGENYSRLDLLLPGFHADGAPMSRTANRDVLAAGFRRASAPIGY